VCNRVGERADRPEKLDHRAGPAVGHDQRQRVLVRRADVNEVNGHAIDLGRELRQRVQPRFDTPEVVVVRPITRELLECRQLHTLRAVVDELLAGPAGRFDAAVEVIDVGLRKLNLERPDAGGDVVHLDAPHHSPLGRTSTPAGPYTQLVLRLG
jgi:hypothetical protein